MAKYGMSFLGRGCSATVDTVTVYTDGATGAGSIFNVAEISISGEASSGAFERLGVIRWDGVTEPATVGTAIVLQPIAKWSAAAGVLAGHGWTTEGSISNANILTPAINAYGGVYSWVAPPGWEIVVGDGTATQDYLFLRARNTNSSTVSGHYLIEEL
jgi:hypothetical protein